MLIAIGHSFSVNMSPLNVDRLQDWIDQGRLDPSKPITMKELNDSRCLHGVKDGVKLLARVRGPLPSACAPHAAQPRPAPPPPPRGVRQHCPTNDDICS